MSENKLNIAQEAYQFVKDNLNPTEYNLKELKRLFPERIRSTF